MTIKTNILLRIYFIGLLCVGFGIAVLAKIYHIQTYNNGYWRSLADTLSTRFFDIEAERGDIFSDEGELLATTVPYFDLYVDFGSDAMDNEIFKANVDSLAFYMSKYFGKYSKLEYKKRLTEARLLKRRYYPFKRNVDFATLKKIKQWPLFREGKYKGGLIIETQQKRYNPFGILAQRTIGYVKKDKESIGLEAAFNRDLGGINGKMLKQKIAGGTWMPIDFNGTIEPKNGYNIHTTINIGLQDIAESSLLDAIQTYNADYASAIVMEVKTGAIKAIVNIGKNKDNTYSENYNNAIATRYEPGSVFKLAGYLALFDDNFITLEDSINTNYAQATFGKLSLSDDGHNQQYKFLKPQKALAVSSNVAIAKWTYKFYNEDRTKFYEKLAQFGLTVKTNIEVAGEPEPLIKSPENWSYYTLPWMAHGYELKLTPLQILTFYNAIANKGYRMQPYLVDRISQNGATIKTITTNKKIKICSEQAAINATEILKAVVNDVNGTAHRIQTMHYQIAGKSGTAKMSEGTKGYTNKNLSTFVGFFPAENPLYSCIVVLSNPQGEITSGGYVAAPVFRTIADKIITSNIKNNLAINKDTLLSSVDPPRLIAKAQQLNQIATLFHLKQININPNYNYVKAQVIPTQNKIQYTPLIINNNVIPNVKGMMLNDAIALLENLGCRVSFSGKGKINTQSIAAGTPLLKGSIIHLTLNEL